MAFTKATKHQSKLRLAISGPSGSGKTYTALRTASGIVAEVGGRIAVVDTESGSARKYASQFDFDVEELRNKAIGGYCTAIEAAGSAGYTVLIIDSLTHAWQELLTNNDKLAATKFKGNSWAAWSESRPSQRQLVNTILASPLHIIATMRSKTEWTQEMVNGKMKPVKVGLAPEQDKGIEYEFDMLMELSIAHMGTVSKDRTGKFQDKILDMPGEGFGKELVAWLSDGDLVPSRKSESVDIDADPMTDDGVFKSAFSSAVSNRQLNTLAVLNNAKSLANVESLLHLSLPSRHRLLNAIREGKFDEHKILPAAEPEKHLEITPA